MTKPKRLAEGDTIAIISPSWGGPSIFPHVFDAGLDCLRDRFGLRVREYPSARMAAKVLYENPAIRAADINDAFADPEVSGIIASIGGSDSIRILEFLDIDLIRANQKFVMGYSDTTTVLAYLNMLGLRTFYGPSIMAGFAYLENFPEALEECRAVLFGKEVPELRAFPAWSERYRDWKTPENCGKVEDIFTDDVGHRWLNKGEPARGPLWGGCLEVLEMMNGTFAWPRQDFWKGRVLFIETSEEKPTPGHVGQVLRNFGVQGIIAGISGLLIARPKLYTREEKLELEETVKRVVVGEFGRKDLTIVANLDIGHTDPRHILPYGAELRIDPEAETLTFAESFFA